MADRVNIKICGMRDPVNIREVGALLPDFMGFIFYKPSPRYVGENFELPADFPSSVKRVGVFVNESVDHILRVSRKHRLTYAQLHGEESIDVCRKLRNENLRVIKVFRIGEQFDFSALVPFNPMVDYFMFDTRGKYYGGNAQVFDWRILKQYDQEIPFFLSGGLNPQNIAAISALTSMNLYAIDLNSGVEQEAGIKDIVKIRNVMNEVKFGMMNKG
jgi:phosphoribosylanthranilate isomerase